MKNQYLYFILLIAIVSFLFMSVSSNIVNSKIAKIEYTDKQIKKAQEKLNSTRIMNEQLSQFTQIIRNSLTKDKTFTSAEVNAFVKQLADLADTYKIAVISMYPKDVFTSTNLVEQQYIMEINCNYIQMGQFLSVLESLDNIIRVNSLDVVPIDLTANSKKTDEQKVKEEKRYRVTIELSVFKVIKEA